MIEGLSTPERAAQWSTARRALLDANGVTSVGTLDGTGPDCPALLRRRLPGDRVDRSYGRIACGEPATIVDQETGNGGLVSDSLPRIAWIGDSTYVAAWSFPYPRVEVRVMPRVDSRHAVQGR